MEYMKIPRFRYLNWLGLSLCLVAMLLPVRQTQAIVLPFDATYILSDEEFNNAGALSCDQIQAFLNERPGILKGYFDEGKPASQIFCEQAARFSLNPRILLTLAQKEMRVLSDPEPDEKQLAWALGCGPGWNSTRGFANQVECAARTLRKRFDKDQLGEVVDGVVPANRATLALYGYTTHVWGNQDFHKIWTQYWPDDVAAQPVAIGGQQTAPAAAASALADLPVVDVATAYPINPIIVDSRIVETVPQIKANTTCRSGWGLGTRGLGGHMFVTPNSATLAESTNWAIWRPQIPAAGLYRVSVFVPERAAVVWACGNLAAVLDTSSARYEVRHANGSSAVTVNQAPLGDVWVDLGSFYFNIGSNGYVKLSDVTGEPSNTRWVSFDEVKFEFIQP